MRACMSGDTSIRVSIMGGASSRAMTMATACVKSMSRPWKGSGRSCGVGCARIGAFPKRNSRWVVFQKWRWTEMHVTLGLIFVALLRKEWPMTFIAVRCPHCQSDHIVKRGKTARGTQRYLCQNTLCTRGSFLLDYCNRRCLPEVKQTIIDRSLNASGVRDTARSLHICPNTVLCALKKERRSAGGGEHHCVAHPAPCRGSLGPGAPWGSGGGDG